MDIFTKLVIITTKLSTVGHRALIVISPLGISFVVEGNTLFSENDIEQFVIRLESYVVGLLSQYR